MISTYQDTVRLSCANTVKKSFHLNDPTDLDFLLNIVRPIAWTRLYKQIIATKINTECNSVYQLYLDVISSEEYVFINYVAWKHLRPILPSSLRSKRFYWQIIHPIPCQGNWDDTCKDYTKEPKAVQQKNHEIQLFWLVHCKTGRYLFPFAQVM